MIIERGQIQQGGKWRGALSYVWGIFPALATIAGVFALWHLSYEHLGALILPAPLDVLRRVFGILQETLGRETIATTMYHGTYGLSLAIILGISGGLLAGMSRTLALLLRPLITLLLGMPPIVWIVLAIFWFGMGSTSAIFTVAITVLPMLFAAAMMGMMSMSEELKDMLKVYRLPFAARLKQLYLPHLSQQLLPALIVATGSGLKITVMAELLGGNQGIGSALASARAMLDTTDVMAYVIIIISLIMFVEYALLEPLKRWILPVRSRGN